MYRNKPSFDKDALKLMTQDTERYIKKFPKLGELYLRLMASGGKYILLDYQDAYYWLERMINSGEYMYPDHISYQISKRCKFKPFMCYQNLTDLHTYPAKRIPQNTRVYIGYSLMTLEDLWIQHVWMYDGKTIYESTPIKSSRYYGIPITITEFNAWMNDYRWKFPPGTGYMDFM